MFGYFHTTILRRLKECDWPKLCAENTSGAFIKYGHRISVVEVLDIVAKDQDYFERTGGGITLSGGEPMAQPEFALALLEGARQRGIHAVLDTSSYMSEVSARRTLSLVDRYLFDYKATDEGEHLTLTGRKKAAILRSLEILQKGGALVTLRCPLIPGVNDTSKHLAGIAALVNTNDCIDQINLLSWHAMGNAKYPKLARSIDSKLTDGYTNAETKSST